MTAALATRGLTKSYRSLNSSGVVPLALGIPAALALGLVLVRRRRRSLI
jgi:LPXTG-motif cell wall-anchored protein